MDKTSLLKYFKINKKLSGQEHTTHLVYDNYAKRDKRLSVISPDNYDSFALDHFIKLFYIFSSERNLFSEFLIEWGILDDNSLYVLRDARDVSLVPDELFNVNQIPHIILDILISLYNLHRNNYYYGGVKREDILYKYNRRHKTDCFSFFLSGVKILRADVRADMQHLQKEDIKSLVFSAVSFLKAKDIVKYEKSKNLNIQQSIDFFFRDKIIRDIIYEIYRAEESILYYIRLLVKNLFYNDEAQRQFYNSSINRLYPPDIPIERHKFQGDIVGSHNLIVINGAPGIGKSTYVSYILNIFRRMKYKPFVFNASGHDSNNYDFIRNFADLISALLKRGDSLIFERFSNVSDEISSEERMYLLYRFDETIKPVFVLENIENADESIITVFKSLIEAGIYVIVTKNNDIHNEQYIKLVKGLVKNAVYSVSLLEWSVNEISSFIELMLFNENKQKIRIFAELLHKNGIRVPKKIIDLVAYILSRDHSVFSNDLNDFRNTIDISIGLFSSFKENLVKNLLPEEYSVLKTLFLFPCSMDVLMKLHNLSGKELNVMLNSLLFKKIVALEKNRYLIKDAEINNELSSKLSKHEIQREYDRIAQVLLKYKDISAGIPPLMLASYLLNGNYQVEAANVIFEYSSRNEMVIGGGRLIWYYNKAMDIFRKNQMKNEQIIMLERLFDIHHKRSDYSKAESILIMLSRLNYDSYRLYKKYALLLESTSDNKSAIEYYNKAFSSIKNTDDIISKIEIYLDIARLFIKTYRIEEANNILEKATLLENEHNMRDKHNIILSLMGEIYMLKGDYESAIRVSVESAELSEHYKDHYILSQTLSNIGQINFRQRAFDKAFVYYEKALDLSTSSDNIQGISKSCFNLGCINVALGNFSKAYDQFTNAKLFHQKTGDRRQYCHDVYMISYILTETGEISKAFYSVKEGIEIADKIKDQESKAMMLFNFGKIYHKLGSYGESINYYFYSREIAKKIGLNDLSVRIYNSLSYLMFELGDYTKAGQFAHKSIVLEKEQKSGDLFPFNNAIIIASKIILDKAGDPLGLIRELKNEENLPDNFYRFNYYRVVYDTGRFLGVRDLMIYSLQLIKDLHLDKISIWCDQLQKLCHQWLFNDMPEDEIRKCMSVAEEMDYGELQWTWQYILANFLYASGKHEESYNHYLCVFEKLKDRIQSVSEGYRNAYISNPFRKFAYNKGEKVFEKYSNLYY